MKTASTRYLSAHPLDLARFSQRVRRLTLIYSCHRLMKETRRSYEPYTIHQSHESIPSDLQHHINLEVTFAPRGLDSHKHARIKHKTTFIRNEVISCQLTYTTLIIYVWNENTMPCSHHASSSILMSHQAVMISSMPSSPVNHKSRS